MIALLSDGEKQNSFLKAVPERQDKIADYLYTSVQQHKNEI